MNITPAFERTEFSLLPKQILQGNIGHLETASGIAGLIKSCLCLQNRSIVPTAGFSQLNPELLQWQKSIYVADGVEVLPSSRPMTELVIGVNSYGFGGSNAFVLLQSAPAESPAARSPSPSEASAVRCLPITSHFKDGVEQTRAALSTALDSGTPLSELLHRCSVNVGGYHSNRTCIIGNEQEISNSLCAPEALSPGSPGLAKTVSNAEPVVVTRAPRLRIGFIFGGQGSQWDKMITSADIGCPLFKRCLDTVLAVYKEALDQPIDKFRQQLSSPDLADLSIALPAIMIWTFVSTVHVSAYPRPCPFLLHILLHVHDCPTPPVFCKILRFHCGSVGFFRLRSTS